MRSGLRAAARSKPQSSGPRVRVGGSASGMSGMGSQGSQDLAMIRAYKTNGTVHSNVAMLAEATSSATWGMFRKGAGGGGNRYTTNDQGSDQRKQVLAHAALNCLEMPACINVGGIRWPIWDQMGLFEVSQIWQEACGRSYWVVDTAEGASPVPLGLWPVRPDRMTPVPDPKRYLAGWIYTAPDGRERVPLLPTEVIFCRRPDPEDQYGGAGPVQSVLSDIEAADYAAQWNRNYFINSAEPGGVLQLDHKFQEGEYDDLVNSWRETHRGISRAHRVSVLEAGITWVPNTHNAKDMDFANLRGVMRDTIREALGMHKVMTGVSEDVNRANAQTGEEVFASWKVRPRLNRWKNVLNTQYLQLFGATAAGNEIDYWYPQPANREQDALELTTKCNGVLTLITAGFHPDDALKVVGLPSMRVVEQATQRPALPPSWVAPPPAAPAESATALLDRVAQRQLAAWNSLAGAAA